MLLVRAGGASSEDWEDPRSENGATPLYVLAYVRLVEKRGILLECFLGRVPARCGQVLLVST